MSRELFGSTAATLAEKAHCPVAIIRTPHVEPIPGPDWIVVAIDKDADNDTVVKAAMNEARLRQAPLLAVGVSDEDFGQTANGDLDGGLGKWKHSYPDVDVYPVGTSAGIAGFLGGNTEESVQLAVVGSTDAYGVAQIIGPHSHPILRHGRCSVLIVR